MSDATDKLARTRQAILEHVARRERRHDPREETAQGFAEAGSPPYDDDDDIPDPGAMLTFARPWKLISIGTILVAVLKSGQLSHLITAAMSASDYRKDHNRPE
ncbi:MAG: hypothetical protein K0R58_4356 [Ramlibacter sp.]|nr:hypothetical protein [Ramlibacter sp.]